MIGMNKNMTTETTVKERPILFSAPMVRAILAGQKTQTRRVMTPQPEHVWGWGVKWGEHDFMAHVRYPGCHPPDPWVRCPYGAPPHREYAGDRLWVRESWNAVNPRGVFWDQLKPSEREGQAWAAVLYKATEEKEEDRYIGRWCPSIHMPRWASRLTLSIESIRVERLQDITEEDAKAEGVAAWAAAYCSRRPEDELYARAYFELMWNHDNSRRGYGWDSNPFCWSLSFRLLAPTRGQEG